MTVAQDGVWFGGADITGKLDGETIGGLASEIAADGRIRALAVESQREFASGHDVVMDGRDIGTVVLPNAQLKIYLTASPLQRARRRAAELGAGAGALPRLVDEIVRRDERDATREIAPLAKAADAVEIDSSDLSAEEVADRIVALCAQRK